MTYKEACNYFPGGTQLFSKRPINYSNNYPYKYSDAKGINIYNGNKKYIDFSTMSQGACILGYADNNVDNVVKHAIDNGNISSINSIHEIELAKKLRKYEPNKMFRYFRSGGEAMAGAVRTVRAFTGKSVLLCNGYHGWSDWYLAANILPDAHNHLNITTSVGVPKELKGTCFYFDSLESLEKLIKEHKENLAGIVIEPCRYKIIDKEIIELLKTVKVPIIVDEITTGWRYCLGSMAKEIFKGFDPDIIVYGKAISNGFPFSVVCGKKKVMEAINKTFISSTYWTDSIGTVAALETINQLEKKSYQLRDRVNTGLSIVISDKFKDNPNRLYSPKSDGFNGMIHYYPKDRTKWVKFMLKKGYLVTDQIYLSFSHNLEDVNKFIEVMIEYDE